MKYAFTHVNVLDGTADMALQNDMTVLVSAGKIEKITKSTDYDSSYKTIDMSGKYLVPGLINLHAHLFGTGQPSKILGGGGLQKKVVAFVHTPLGNKVMDMLVASAAKTAVKSGTTTVRAVGDFVYSDVRIRNKINSGKMIGPRLFVSGPAITAIGGHGYGTFAVSSNDEDELRALVRQNVEHDVDFIKTCSTGGVMDAKNAGEPAELKMTKEQLFAVVDEAHKLGKVVASHTESPDGVALDLSVGVDTVEHGAPVGSEVIEEYRKNGTAYVLTLSPAIPLATLSHEITKLNPVAESVAKVVMQNMVDGAKQAIAEGLPFGIGTDCSCPFSTQYNMWRELAYLVKFVGTDEKFALHTATLSNAKILGIDKETGSIEEGKCADLLFVNENPLENLRTLSDPVAVVARGELLSSLKVKKNKYIESTLDELLSK